MYYIFIDDKFVKTSRSKSAKLHLDTHSGTTCYVFKKLTYKEAGTKFPMFRIADYYSIEKTGYYPISDIDVTDLCIFFDIRWYPAHGSLSIGFDNRHGMNGKFIGGCSYDS